MGINKRGKVKLQQAKKRHKKRLKLVKDGQDPAELLYGKTWVGPRKSAA